MQAAARSIGRRLLVLQASTEAQIAASFATLSRERVGELVVQNDAFFDSQRNQIMALASRNSIPAIYHIREFPAAGGLMSYGASLADAYRQVGIYAGRILKGATSNRLTASRLNRKVHFRLGHRRRTLQGRRDACSIRSIAGSESRECSKSGARTSRSP